MQPLATVESEFRAIRDVVAQALRDDRRPGHADLSQAAAGLETAYIARLFSVFEGLLREYLTANDPRRRSVPYRAVAVINRTAAVWRIPDLIRDDVQEAREYRNSVVHPDGTAYAAISLSEARSRMSDNSPRLKAGASTGLTDAMLPHSGL